MEGIPDRVDSKFRFVLLSAQRAELMMRGAQPRVEAKNTKPTHLGMKEIMHEVVNWDYGPGDSPEAEVAAEG